MKQHLPTESLTKFRNKLESLMQDHFDKTPPQRAFADISTGLTEAVAFLITEYSPDKKRAFMDMFVRNAIGISEVASEELSGETINKH